MTKLRNKIEAVLALKDITREHGINYILDAVLEVLPKEYTKDNQYHHGYDDCLDDVKAILEASKDSL